MQLLDKVRETEFLGREFLVWLWFRAETERGFFDLGEEGTAEVWIDGKITLRSEKEGGTETITCSGRTSNMKEARFALKEDKQVVQATVKLAVGDDQWSFTLDSTWMNYKSLKTPKVVQDRAEDPDGIFYEKAFLVEKALSAMDKIYSSFIEIRLSPKWQEKEGPELTEWIREGSSWGPSQ